MIKWDKIEHYINQALIWLGQFMKQLILKLAPHKFTDTMRTWCDQVIHFLQNFKQKISALLALCWEKLKDLKTPAFKEKILTKKQWLVDKLKELARLRKSELLAIILALITPYLQKVKIWFTGMKPGTLVVSTILTAIGSITVANMIISGRQIMDHGNKGRAPAAASPDLKKYGIRPSYYKRENKYYVIGNFKIPIYIGETKLNMKTLQIEFTLLTTTRNAKNYLQKNEHISRDWVLGNLEPLIPEFPITNEGKSIIKQKIRFELNRLLKEKGFSGRVQNVYIKDIITN